MKAPSVTSTDGHKCNFQGRAANPELDAASMSVKATVGLQQLLLHACMVHLAPSWA